MRRDRNATRAAILESAASLISLDGLQKLGINSLAAYAECDKVLIYRYFGGMSGLLSALADEYPVWPAFDPEKAQDLGDSLADAVTSLLLEERSGFLESWLMIEAAGGECYEGGPLSAGVARQRAENHDRMVVMLRGRYRIPPYVDLDAVIEILSAALIGFEVRSAHNVVRANTTRGPAPAHFDTMTPANAHRIDKTVGAIARALLEPHHS